MTAAAAATGLTREDVLPMPSSSRAGVMHLVAVNVLAGCTTGCSCEAGQRGQMCAHRKEVEANEGAWGFARCTSCGVLMRLGFWHGMSSTVRIWLCVNSAEHSAHEPGVAILFRSGEPCYAVGSSGSWRVAS